MGNRRTTLLALAAVILTLGALWYIQRPVIPQETTLAEVQAEAVRGGYRLMTTEALAELYRQHPAHGLLVDTRQDRSARWRADGCRTIVVSQPGALGRERVEIRCQMRSVVARS